LTVKLTGTDGASAVSKGIGAGSLLLKAAANLAARHHPASALSEQAFAAIAPTIRLPLVAVGGLVAPHPQQPGEINAPQLHDRRDGKPSKGHEALCAH
jgi:hypothetical protein